MRRKTQSQKKQHSTGNRKIEIMDTTLRDGEQTDGVSLSAEEKRHIAQMLLEEVRVDRIEVASAKVSEGEQRSVLGITRWAKESGCLNRVEVLGFTDLKKSVDWSLAAECKVINLLTKGSLKHCEGQLRRSLREHLDDIRKTIEYGIKNKVEFNVYLEDWSNGMLDSPEYVWEMLSEIVQLPIHRIMLPDTLGVLNPDQVSVLLQETVQKHPEKSFDFHAHNDYGLAVANTLAAVKAGARGVHCTINGMGERAGNTPLDETVVCLRDHTRVETNVDESKLKKISQWVETFSGKHIADNKPICGANVFTQTAGIHADGDKKGNLYFTRLSPERFGRQREYALGKLSGKASLEFNLKRLNIDLTPDEIKLVQKRVIELGDIKQHITAEDLPFIISDVLAAPDQQEFAVKNCVIVTSRTMKPIANAVFEYQGQLCEQSGAGDGGYDAFMTALRAAAKNWKIKIPILKNFELRIPPGGRSDALVETTISWEGGIKTRGVNSDQVLAAIEATEKMINLVITQQKRLIKIKPQRQQKSQTESKRKK